MKAIFFLALLLSAHAYASAWSADLMTNAGLSEVLFSVEQGTPGMLRRFGNTEGGQVTGVLREANALGMKLGAAAEGYDHFAPTPLLTLSWPSRLWLQEMSKPASYFREGLWNADKVDNTALYSVHGKVKVYTFGRVGAFSKKTLDGVLVLLETSFGGDIIPYILSINLVKPIADDEIKQQDLDLIQGVLANQYSSRKLLVRAGGVSDGEAVKVKMPEGWKQIDEVAGENSYSGSKLVDAKLLPLNLGSLALAQNTHIEERQTYFATPYETLSPLALGSLYQAIDLHVIPRRAGVPLYAVLRKSRDELLSTLGMNESQARAAALINRGAAAEIQPEELRRPKSFLLTPADFILIRKALGMKAIEILRHWPLLNAVAQIMALTESERELVFNSENLSGFLAELREKLASRSLPKDGETMASWPHAILNRHYFLQLPQVEDCREALHAPGESVL